MLFVAAGQGSMTPRPQLVSYVLLVVLLEAWRQTEGICSRAGGSIPLSFALVAVPRLLVHRGRLRMPRGGGDRPRAVGPAGRGSPAGCLPWPRRIVLLNPIGLASSRRRSGVRRSAYITEWERTSMLTAGPLGRGRWRR